MRSSTMTIVIIAVVGVMMAVVLSRAEDDSTSVASRPAATAGWHRSLPEAIAEATQRGSLIVVDVYADWCGWCKKMEADTLAHPEVQVGLKDFTLLKLNADEQREVVQRYPVRGLPTTLVLNSKGELVATRSGYMPVMDYLRFLEAARQRAIYLGEKPPKPLRRGTQPR